MKPKTYRAALAPTLVLAGLAAAVGSARATEYGTVVATTPVVHQVPVAQRLCHDEQVITSQRSGGSGAGALIGAIAGAALGNAMGTGGGRAAATGIGMVAGAAIGDRVEAEGSPPQVATTQRCRTVTRYEQRIVGYDVVYDHQGVRRAARVATDPGERIALETQVVPVGALPSGAHTGAVAPSWSSAPVVRRGVPSDLPTPVGAEPGDIVEVEEAPSRVVVSRPRYVVVPEVVPAYPYVAPWWPAISIGLGVGGHWGGGRHHHRWHGGHRGGHGR